MEPDGDRMFGVARGEQSSSSKTGVQSPQESSSSEKAEDVQLFEEASVSMEELEFMDERRGQDGYAHEGDCGRELDEEGISIAEVLQEVDGGDGVYEKYIMVVCVGM